MELGGTDDTCQHDLSAEEVEGQENGPLTNVGICLRACLDPGGMSLLRELFTLVRPDLSGFGMRDAERGENTLRGTPN